MLGLWGTLIQGLLGVVTSLYMYIHIYTYAYVYIYMHMYDIYIYIHFLVTVYSTFLGGLNLAPMTMELRAHIKARLPSIDPRGRTWPRKRVCLYSTGFST